MFIFLQISLSGKWRILKSCAVLTQFHAVFPAQIRAASLITVETDICSSIQEAKCSCMQDF